jgi:hypothetical protein
MDAIAAHNPFSDLIANIGIGAGAIMADPGIAFHAWSPKGEGKSPQRHYHCETVEKVKALPVATIAAPDAFLFLWWPSICIEELVPCMRAWGFSFSGWGFLGQAQQIAYVLRSRHAAQR